MYTRCPYCHTYFKVLAEHLKKAGGQVRCGECYKVFNSIGNLIEKLPVPLTDKHKKGAATAQSQPQATNKAQHSAVTDSAEQETVPQSPTIPDALSSPINDSADAVFDNDDSMESITLLKKDKISDVETGPHSLNKELIVHPTLGNNDENEAHKYNTLYWGIGLFAVLGIFVFQYSYFYRGELSQNAGMRPWIEKMCAITNCEIPARHDIRAIKLIRRDITTHPKVDNALLISAALVNESKDMQPFPIMRIRLSDTVGQILASRKFNPQDYMDVDINLRKGMPPGSPIQISLEIVDPGKTAVNFEFDFFYPTIK